MSHGCPELVVGVSVEAEVGVAVGVVVEVVVEKSPPGLLSRRGWCWVEEHLDVVFKIEG